MDSVQRNRRTHCSQYGTIGFFCKSFQNMFSGDKNRVLQYGQILVRVYKGMKRNIQFLKKLKDIRVCKQSGFSADVQTDQMTETVFVQIPPGKIFGQVVRVDRLLPDQTFQNIVFFSSSVLLKASSSFSRIKR